MELKDLQTEEDVKKYTDDFVQNYRDIGVKRPLHTFQKVIAEVIRESSDVLRQRNAIRVDTFIEKELLRIRREAEEHSAHK